MHRHKTVHIGIFNIFVRILQAIITALLFSGCHGKEASGDVRNTVSPFKADTATTNPAVKRISFKNIGEIIADTNYTDWVERNDTAASLALHFMYKDTLAVSYSPECWLLFPYKAEADRIVVYWDDNIDSKYNFDIVKVVHATIKSYIGKPFMVLQLKNDTTLKATYLLDGLVSRINSAGKGQIFFTGCYTLAQKGFL